MTRGVDDGGTLYVVATPIGNLADVSLRSIDVLRAVPLVAAEDTRLTRRLWARHDITTRLVSYHARSPDTREGELIAHLEGGDDLALVTDAGTPLVSDPGEGLVAAWAARDGRVIAIPGPSAVLAALTTSGLRVPRWGFEGFLPRRGSERRARIERIATDDRATVLFEAPGRLAATLRELAAACGDARRGSVARELTKRFEETWRGTLAELADRASAGAVRGEITIVVEGATEGWGGPAGGTGAGSEGTPASDLEAAAARVDALVASGVARSAAARKVAAETGHPRRVLFAHPRK
ncbi:MAG: 16S rRNA (cytidine(1402)-2'-O)-methyltransferase [Chloroflexi bacterium]|nr:16S rRNA (cytidine(1402)-2'-O)-methyltransferase [Chloroflexota bacterium]